MGKVAPRYKKHRQLLRFEVPMIIAYDGGEIEQTVVVFAADKIKAIIEAEDKLDLKDLPKDHGNIEYRVGKGFLDE